VTRPGGQPLRGGDWGCQRADDDGRVVCGRGLGTAPSTLRDVLMLLGAGSLAMLGMVGFSSTALHLLRIDKRLCLQVL